MKIFKLLAKDKKLQVIFVSVFMIVSCIILIGWESNIPSYSLKSADSFYYKAPLWGSPNPCDLDKTFYWMEKGSERSLKFNYMEIKKLSIVAWVFYDCRGKRLAVFWPGKYTRDMSRKKKYKNKISIIFLPK